MICCFCPGLVCTLVCQCCLWQQAGWDRAVMGRCLGWHHRGSWVSLLASCWSGQTQWALCDVALLATGFTRHSRFPLPSCDTVYGDLPGCCLAAWVSAGVHLPVLSLVKEPWHWNVLDLTIKGKAFMNLRELAGFSSPLKCGSGQTHRFVCIS